ncbi:MAG TPA: hypothetical protein VK213_08020 [Bacteroidales bacterium]|nr:hypothetical protein [Bacteroidales bacterium]
MSFILGTLDDYMGRALYPEVENRIDRFYDYEYPLIQKLDSLINPLVSDYERRLGKDSPNFLIFSKQLTFLINRNYNYIDSHSRTMNHDTVYYGVLRNNLFDSDLKKISFLTGAYIRYGNKTGNLYSISLSNSVSKIKTCEVFLKDLGCKEVVYTISENTRPTGVRVTFHPTELLLRYFSNYFYLRDQIDKNFEKKIKKLKKKLERRTRTK